jgi:lysophospholipase L1-like esterase
MKRAIIYAASLALTGCATAPDIVPAMPSGAHYVAMGSSFASGPGVASVVPGTPARCTRSTENYAQQVARQLNLRLTDTSCGGARTAHILGPWNELPPQIEALTADTALVTITIGGNDVGYIGGLISASCAGADRASAPPMCQSMAGQPPEPGEAEWRALASSLDRITAEVRRRSPAARLVFVDYLTVVSDGPPCAATPFAADRAATGRAIAARLAAETAAAAARAGADVLRASALSANHGACAEQPWMGGFIAPPGSGLHIPYHPNQAGMTAVADALAALLRR